MTLDEFKAQARSVRADKVSQELNTYGEGSTLPMLIYAERGSVLVGSYNPATGEGRIFPKGFKQWSRSKRKFSKV